MKGSNAPGAGSGGWGEGSAGVERPLFLPWDICSSQFILRLGVLIWKMG